MANIIPDSGSPVRKPTVSQGTRAVIDGGAVTKRPKATRPPAPTPTNYPDGSVTYATPPPAGGSATPAAGAAAKKGTQPDLTADMLKATMAAIAAEYGMTEQQLMAEEGEVGRQYRLLFAEAQRKELESQSALQAGMVDRGIARSGIFADEAAKQQAMFAEQRAAWEAQKAAQLQQIASQEAVLPAQRAAAEAAAAQAAAAAGLDLDLIKAQA